MLKYYAMIENENFTDSVDVKPANLSIEESKSLPVEAQSDKDRYQTIKLVALALQTKEQLLADMAVANASINRLGNIWLFINSIL